MWLQPYFQVINSRCTIWIRELLFTWIDISCSFICSLISAIFSSHVDILILIGSFSSNYFDEIEHVLNFSKFAWGIHVGMDEMFEIVHQATCRFFGIDEVYKLVMDEMYEIGWFITKFEHEYSRICVVSVLRAQTLCKWWNPRWCSCFGCSACVSLCWLFGMYDSKN